MRDKLLRYSLDLTNEIGKPKARGFERILGITIEDVDYLESAIRAGILTLPVSTVRDNPPWAVVKRSVRAHVRPERPYL